MPEWVRSRRLWYQRLQSCLSCSGACTCCSEIWCCRLRAGKRRQAVCIGCKECSACWLGLSWVEACSHPCWNTGRLGLHVHEWRGCLRGTRESCRLNVNKRRSACDVNEWRCSGETSRHWDLCWGKRIQHHLWLSSRLTARCASVIRLYRGKEVCQLLLDLLFWGLGVSGGRRSCRSRSRLLFLGRIKFRNRWNFLGFNASVSN